MSLTQSVGRWLKEITSDSQLLEEIGFLLSTNEQEITDVQNALCKPLKADDGHQLAKQIAWLDSYLFRIASLHADANTLLDLAEKHFLVPVGQMRPCTLPDGSPFVDHAGRTKKTADGTLYAKVTDEDRRIELRARCAVFRRLRDEYAAMLEVIRNRMWLGQKILGEMESRHRAAGYFAGKPRGS